MAQGLAGFIFAACGLLSLKRMVKEKEKGDVFGEFGAIMLEYVPKNNRDFATAVYPAVRHTLDHGVLDQVINEQCCREEGALDMS